MNQHAIVAELNVVTGFGKTVIGAKMIEDYAKKHGKFIVWLTHGRDLVQQAERTIRETIPDPHGTMSLHTAVVDFNRFKQPLIDKMIRTYDLVVLDDIIPHQRTKFHKWFYDTNLSLIVLNSTAGISSLPVDPNSAITDNGSLSTIISTESR